MGEKKVDVVVRRKAVTSPVALSVPDKDQLKNEIAGVISTILKRLLSEPEKVSVTIEEGDRTTIFEIDIGEGDFGRLIGSKGKNIASLRTIVAAMSAVHGCRAIVRVKDEDRFF